MDSYPRAAFLFFPPHEAAIEDKRAALPDLIQNRRLILSSFQVLMDKAAFLTPYPIMTEG